MGDLSSRITNEQTNERINKQDPFHSDGPSINAEKETMLKMQNFTLLSITMWYIL